MGIFRRLFRKPRYTFSSVQSFKMLTEAQKLINNGRESEARLVILSGQEKFPKDAIWFTWKNL